MGTYQASLVVPISRPSCFARRQDRAVQRGLARRQAEPIRHLGVDEKAFRKGHQYMTVVSGVNYFFALTTIISPCQRQLLLTPRGGAERSRQAF